jgi:hypothetical protein
MTLSFRGFVALVLVVSLSLICFGAYQTYVYRVGTPATVTSIECDYTGRGGQSCSGTWRAGEASHSGHIECSPLASVLAACNPSDVRVHGGTAYTAMAGPTFILFGTFLAAFLAVAGRMRMRARKAAGEP